MTTTTITYPVMTAPPPIPTDESGYATTHTFNSVVDNVSWQLYGGALSERNIEIWAGGVFSKNYAKENFDLRDYYDIDGYLLRGYATFNKDPEVGGYVYLCVEVPDAATWTCATTSGKASIMKDVQSQKTVESTSLIDFTVVVNDLTGLVAKKCTHHDGTRGCWRQEFVDATPTASTSKAGALNTDPACTYTVWMYMARENATTASGFRWTTGDKVKTAVIAKQSNLEAQTNAQIEITLAGASHLVTALGAFVAGTAAFLF